MHQYATAIAERVIDRLGGFIEAGRTFGQKGHPDRVWGLIRWSIREYADNQPIETGARVGEAANKQILDNLRHR